MADERFLRSQRIRSGRDFSLFRASKVRSHGLGFLVVQKMGGAPEGRPRIAIVTSRKTGNAVRRNALRRMVREFFRRIQWQLHADSDWMVIFLPSSQGMTPENLKSSLAQKMLKMSHHAKHKICPPSELTAVAPTQMAEKAGRADRDRGSD